MVTKISVFKFGLIFLLGIYPRLVYSQISDLSGFEGGISLNGHKTGVQSANVADILGDDVPEIIISTADAYLFVFKADGTILWSVAMPSAGCTAAYSNNRMHSSPTVADINNDGTKEVIVGYGSIGRSACGGGIQVLNGQTGEIISHIIHKKLSNKYNFWANQYAVYSTIAASDTDGDGLMELGYGSYDRNIYIFKALKNAKIKLKLFLHAADTVWSSGTFYDQDGDGIKNFFIGSDISANKYLNPVTHNGGYINSIRTVPDQITQKKYNFRDQKVLDWQTYFDQTVYASPIIADVLPSEGSELISGTGCYFSKNGQKSGRYKAILNLKSGKLLKTLNIEQCSSGQVAVADLDADGDLDIVATSNDGDDDGNGSVVAFDPVNGTQFWITSVSWGAAGSVGPVTGDLDGNGSQEVIIADGNSTLILDGTNGGRLYEFIAGSTVSSPVIADIDGDSKPELVILGKNKLFVKTNFTNNLDSTPTSQPAYLISTSKFRMNEANTGVFGE